MGKGELPTVEQAVAMTMSACIAPEFCRYVYDDWSSRGGKDGAGIPVDWLHYVTKRWNRERGDWDSGTHKGTAQTKPPLTKAEQDRETLRQALL